MSERRRTLPLARAAALITAAFLLGYYATALAAHGFGEGADAVPHLERAIARLPRGARTVFVLHDVEGYRHEEVATMTGVSVGTTKAQLHRARKLLREVMNS